jgi:D-sedoheptulose 7-phosphate isomerase
VSVAFLAAIYPSPVKTFFESYASRLAESLQRHDWHTSEKLADAMRAAWKENRQVFICGNGGSCGNANHWENDFVYPMTKTLGHGLKIRSLGSNPSVLTCLANDEGYEHVFSAQLRIYAERGDLLIVFSGSGNSPNILEALRVAREMGVKSCAVVGFDGGKALKAADWAIHFAVPDMQMAEDFQSILGHLMMRVLKEQPSN